MTKEDKTNKNNVREHPVVSAADESLEQQSERTDCNQSAQFAGPSRIMGRTKEKDKARAATPTKPHTIHRILGRNGKDRKQGSNTQHDIAEPQKDRHTLGRKNIKDKPSESEVARTQYGDPMVSPKIQRTEGEIARTDYGDPNESHSAEEDAQSANLHTEVVEELAPPPLQTSSSGESSQPQQAETVQPGAQVILGADADAYAHDDIVEGNSTISGPEGLVEAREVPNADLGEATPVSPDDLEHGQVQQESRRKRTKMHLLWACLAALILIFGIVLAVVLMSVRSSRSSKNSKGQTAGSASIRTLPLHEHVLTLLPPETVYDIQLPDTAQNKAYRWLLDDPNSEDHTDARLVQRFALATFYYALNGEEWYENTNWLSYTEHECNWFHGGKRASALDGDLAVTIDMLIRFMYRIEGPCIDTGGNQSEEYRVLWLYNNGLQGSLPGELYLLTGLQGFNFLNNAALIGTISESIGQMENLLGIVLSLTKVEGTLPTELALNQNLEVLFANVCQLAGSIPTEIGLLSNLEHLWLDENQIEGPIPSEIGGLEKLETLVLWNNGLTGAIPSDVGRMSSLQYIWLQENNLSGRIPSELGELAALQDIQPFYNKIEEIFPSIFWDNAKEELSGHLRLEFNNLTGALPSELGQLSSLIRFNLDKNKLTGHLPSQFGRMSNLKTLDLNTNNLSGPMPSEIGELSALWRLDFYDNRLTGQIPKELGSLANIADLRVVSNLLTGPVPSELGMLKAANRLRFDNNLLSSQLPSELGQLQVLHHFHFANDLFSGPIPPEIAHLPSLREVWLQRNIMSSHIVTEFGLLGNLLNLLLHDSQFSGPIPSEIGLLTKLSLLQLGDNRLSGHIPSQLGLMSGIKSAELHNNSLSGFLPSELAFLPELRKLLLHHNHLSGTLPSQLGLMMSIGFLFLSKNSFTGPMPSELGMLSGVRELVLEGNNLTGNIPFELGHVIEQTTQKDFYIDVSNNDLTGMIPSAFCGLELDGSPKLLFDCSVSLCGCACNCSGSTFNASVR